VAAAISEAVCRILGAQVRLDVEEWHAIKTRIPMSTAEITIKVDADLADAYRSASEQDRRKMDLLASLQLTKYLRSHESLEEAMDAMSQEASRNGMTPEILDSILND
jgi:hypothetical protein